VLDMTGLAQKGGSVYSHIRIAERPEQITRFASRREKRASSSAAT
jgi:Pyruvate/2-oxoacid:ferredoxin oxidoreductase gamma subunit